jgi:Xaa-Pro aminopeptidase
MKEYKQDLSVTARKAEIEKKVENLRSIMSEEGLDGMYISKQEHFAWVTAGGDNIVTRFVEDGICAIFITQNGRYYFCNNIEAQRMIDEEFLDQLGFEARTMWWFENKTMNFIDELIGTSGILAADVALPGAIDANPFIRELEKVLCENEIGRYIHLGNVFSNTIESFMATIKPGDTELEISGRLGAKMWENGIEPVLFLIASDERIYKYRHPIPTEKKLEKLLMISCNARYKGLVTKITRMLHFGKISPEFQEQYRQTAAIENAMADVTKPGVDDIVPYNLAVKMYEDFGHHEMWKVHHQGGPQSYTNGFYLITPDTHNVVKLHQCYGYNPSITGTKTEDGFVVTEEGPLFITYPVTFPAVKEEINGFEYVRPGILEIV